MADAGTIRKPTVGTLTRADLADIVHREIGLSRAEFGRHRRAHPPSYVRTRWPTGRMSRFPASAASSCATRASGSAAIRRPASRCRSRRAACSPSAPARSCASGSPAAAEAWHGRAVRKSEHAFRTIGELAAELGVPQHILRYWETRFPQLRPLQRAGNRRYYRPDDVALARRIHRLLNQEGYTIRGVQQLLAGERRRAARPSRPRATPAAASTPVPAGLAHPPSLPSLRALPATRTMARSSADLSARRPRGRSPDPRACRHPAAQASFRAGRQVRARLPSSRRDVGVLEIDMATLAIRAAPAASRGSGPSVADRDRAGG